MATYEDCMNEVRQKAFGYHNKKLDTHRRRDYIYRRGRDVDQSFAASGTPRRQSTRKTTNFEGSEMICPHCRYAHGWGWWSEFDDYGEKVGDSGEFYALPVKMEREDIDTVRLMGCPSCLKIFIEI